MNRKLRSMCAAISTLLLIVGFLAVFVFAWIDGYISTMECVGGLIVGFILSPIVHELGHVGVADMVGMDYVYVKMFCFRISVKDGKKKFSLASPFEDDQTQVIPKTGGDMQRRAMKYTLGGLISGGIFLITVLLAAVLCSAFGATNYLLWGIVPYAAYLELLNLLPVEYAGGKTDMLVYAGLKNGHDAEKVMLSAMEIQGKLYEGKSFSEIDEALYFNVPQLCEDEPLFAMMLDLRYRYYLEKDDQENAIDCLNRLMGAQAYLSGIERERLTAELVYMHSLTGNVELAQECSKFGEEYLRGNTADTKRALAAFSAESGNAEAVEIFVKQAREALQNERIAGVKKFEGILLSRIKVTEKETA